MKEILYNNIKSFVKKWWALIISWLIIFLLCCICIKQCNVNKDIKQQSTHNIEALTDSLHLYITKSGQLAADKAILIGDVDLLKKVNDSLYQRIKDMGVKNPDDVVYITNDVIHEKHDTVWTSSDLTHYFDFSNKWRELCGNVTLQDSAVGLTIDKDIVHLDYTLAIKDGHVYISSQNPYVKFTNIEGITLPKERKKHFHIGPSVGVGIGADGKFTPQVGVSLTWGLFNF